MNYFNAGNNDPRNYNPHRGAFGPNEAGSSSNTRINNFNPGNYDPLNYNPHRGAFGPNEAGSSSNTRINNINPGNYDPLNYNPHRGAFGPNEAGSSSNTRISNFNPGNNDPRNYNPHMGGFGPNEAGSSSNTRINNFNPGNYDPLNYNPHRGAFGPNEAGSSSNTRISNFNPGNNDPRNYNLHRGAFGPNEAGSSSNTRINNFNPGNYDPLNYNPHMGAFGPNEAGSSSNTRINNFNPGNYDPSNYYPRRVAFAPNEAGSWISLNTTINYINPENNDPTNHNPYRDGFAPNEAGSSSNTRYDYFNSENNTIQNYNPSNVAFAPNGAVTPWPTTSSYHFHCPNGEQPRWLERENRLPTEIHQNNQQSMTEGEMGCFIEFRKLIKLSKKESSETVIIELIATMATFKILLDSELTQDLVAVILKIVAKAFSSCFVVNKHAIMSIVLKPKFMKTLETCVMKMQYEDPENRRKNTYFWGNVEEFYLNLAIVGEALIDAFPTRACEVLPTLLQIVNASIPTFEQQQEIHLSDSTKDRIKNAVAKLEFCKEQLKQRKFEIKRIREEDDFRTLSIYPTCDEILSRRPACPSKNIVEGKYRDVEHYLDVQFRLLKEDFVAPLRRGLTEYLQQRAPGFKQMKKFVNVHIHKEVVFLTPFEVNYQVGVRLKFVDENTSKFFNRKSRGFMYGSLVCFTKDNFVTVLFGRVLDKDCGRHQLVIGFDPEYVYDLNTPYLMIECKIYFEPYYRVLKALQSISEAEFPMKSYLIDVDNTVAPPDYLDAQSVYTIQKRRVHLFLKNTWPSADDLKLNPTQYSAFVASLTQKFAVIQGPPGTGKTYVGLEIVKTLLDERNIAKWYNKTPILIVSFTNYALDQFLEGLIGTTDRILRVGGQCKSILLRDFTTQNKKRSQDIHMYTDALRACKHEMNELMTNIKRQSELITEIQKFDSIIKFYNFDVVDQEIPTSWFSRASNMELIEWLFGKREQSHVNCNTWSEFQTVREHEDIEEIPNIAFGDVFELWSDFEERNLLSVTLLTHKIQAAQQTLADIENGLLFVNFEMKLRTQKILADLTRILEYLKDKLSNARNSPSTSKPRHVNYDFPNLMEPADRWNLYFYWVHSYKKQLVDKMMKLQYQHREVYKQYSEINNMKDMELMKDMLVVGMTTTAAARLQNTLKALKCRIVVVEEAAEVLESHVTVSLTNHCQHLILIGDHQQLRPNTADYRIDKEFNLGISMFERMVLNKVQCSVLDVQHRMHPKIASLLVPHIYPKLENHPSVNNFPPILGIKSRLYFIHHTNPESPSGIDSKANLHEAKFLINLAEYLIYNGYNPEDITILAAYSGQMIHLVRERRSALMVVRNVEIRTLDNYQGEESKIILLSLVRNNEEGKIGFLKEENRVCVALSRAKEGFYMMGNMDMLCENSEIWAKIRKELAEQDSLGTSLPVYCQNHPDKVTLLAQPQDFDKVREGGCNEICGLLLNCGHNCPRFCHILDRVHSTTKCRAQCSRVLCELGHICSKLCYQVCGSCGICSNTQVVRILECGHQHIMDCDLDPKEFKCLTRVTATLPCGHVISTKPCHVDVNEWRCRRPCDSRIVPCGHLCMRRCHITRNDPEHIQYKCCEPCEQVLQGCSTRDHKCQGLCHEKCPPCDIIVKKRLLNCNHIHDVPCSLGVERIACIDPYRGQYPHGGHLAASANVSNLVMPP